MWSRNAHNRLRPALVLALLIGAPRAAGQEDTGSLDCAERHQRLRVRVHDLEERLAAVERGEPAAAAPPAIPLGLQRPPRVVMPGEVAKQALGFGRPVDVFGEVDGDAVAVGADVRVHPGARVRGDAVSVGGEVRVLDGGRVLGAPLALHARPPAGPTGRGLGLGLSAGAAGVLTAGLLPSRVERVIGALNDGPWRSLLVGLLLLVVAPPLVLLSGLTVVGLPLAVALALGLGAAGALGAVGAAGAVGSRLSARLSTWAAALLGGLLLMALWQLPVLGAGAVIGAGIAGLGAAARAALRGGA